ncbi:MAG: hypothetical protein ACK5M9_15825, partial [Mycobacterium sp.]
MTTPNTCEACGTNADELFHNDALGMAVCAECDAAPIEGAASRAIGRKPKPTAIELTTREVADKIGTDPKTLRVFLRAASQGVGSGSRYSFTS